MRAHGLSGLLLACAAGLFAGMAVACGGGEDRAAVLPATPQPSPTPTVGPTPGDAEFVELIAYVGPDGNVWTVNTDGTDATQVTRNGDNAQPAWSPDGSTLAYIHARREIYSANADGTDERQVPLRDHCAEPFGRYGLGAARRTRVQFTPAGRGLRLGIDWGGIINQFICHLPLDAATPALPTINGDEFGINPKDGSIAFTQSGQGCAWTYIVDADGGNRREIGPTMGVRCAIKPEELSVLPYAPTWSPDGEIIAFYGVDGARTSRVYTLDPSDAASAQLMVEAGQVRDLQGGVLGLAWSPDGEFLAYEKDGGIWVLEMATGATRRLVDGTNPAWGRVPSDLVPQPTPTPEPDISVPKPASCPVSDASFCDFVYQIDAALARGDISLIVSPTELTAHTCGYFADLEGPPLQGFSPSICEGQPREAVPECVEWTSTGVAHPYYVCLTKEEYARQFTSVPYTPTESSETVAVVGISFGCGDFGCRGTLFLRDPTEPLSGDPESDNGVFLTATEAGTGWVVSGGGCCIPFLYQGYPEFSWPPD